MRYDSLLYSEEDTRYTLRDYMNASALLIMDDDRQDLRYANDVARPVGFQRLFVDPTAKYPKPPYDTTHYFPTKSSS